MHREASSLTGRKPDRRLEKAEWTSLQQREQADPYQHRRKARHCKKERFQVDKKDISETRKILIKREFRDLGLLFRDGKEVCQNEWNI